MTAAPTTRAPQLTAPQHRPESPAPSPGQTDIARSHPAGERIFTTPDFDLPGAEATIAAEAARHEAMAGESHKFTPAHQLALFRLMHYCRWRVAGCVAVDDAVGVARWHEREQAARRSILVRSLPLLKGFMSHGFHGEPVERHLPDFPEDLYQEAAVAMIRAADRFDHRRGAAFTSFAFGAMAGRMAHLKEIADRRHAILPRHEAELMKNPEALQAQDLRRWRDYRADAEESYLVAELRFIVARNAAALTPAEREALARRFNGTSSRPRRPDDAQQLPGVLLKLRRSLNFRAWRCRVELADLHTRYLDRLARMIDAPRQAAPRINSLYRHRPGAWGRAVLAAAAERGLANRSQLARRCRFHEGRFARLMACDACPSLPARWRAALIDTLGLPPELLTPGSPAPETPGILAAVA